MTFKFLVAFRSSPLVSIGVGLIDICGSDDFVSVCDCFSQVGADSLSVYTNGSLKNLGTTGCRAGAAAFFEDINLGLSISVRSLVSFTLVELQTVVLALECIPVAHSVHLFSDSQAVLDAYISEVDLVYPDFCNWCLYLDVDWPSSSRVWHPDSHMVTGFTSRHTANAYTYLMKALHHQFSMAGFVFKEWIQKAVSIFHDPKVTGVKIADFVYSLCVTFRNNIWLVCAKHHTYMEKNSLIPVDGSISISVSGLVLRFSDGVVKLLGIGDLVFVNIIA
ncbi:hypothetical protein G9A89_004026 [Geosiphon pyriformis]|nr:hypothetical protein G9A89_004026 [Geosiphon pyriformis]